MKKLLLILSVFFATAYKAQTYNSSCVAPDSVVKKYKDDADKLNVRRIYHINSTYKDSITLNKTISATYLKALLAVYNATTIPARDTVVNLYHIHTYNPPLNIMDFLADSNLQWMKNLEHNVFPTGNAKMDYYMTKYSIHKTDYFRSLIDTNADVELTADTNCNLLVLSDTLRIIPGVIAGGANYLGGSGSDIIDSITPTYTWLVYNIGWGDCNNQCMFKHYWGFRVYSDCSVEYGGSYGAPLSLLYAGIKQNEISYNDLKAYPNPTRDKLTVEGLPGKATLSLINVLGEVVYSDDSASINSVLDLGHYAPGIYYLKIKGYEGQRILKVVKE